MADWITSINKSPKTKKRKRKRKHSKRRKKVIQTRPPRVVTLADAYIPKVKIHQHHLGVYYSPNRGVVQTRARRVMSAETKAKIAYSSALSRAKKAENNLNKFNTWFSDTHLERFLGKYDNKKITHLESLVSMSGEKINSSVKSIERLQQDWENFFTQFDSSKRWIDNKKFISSILPKMNKADKKLRMNAIRDNFKKRALDGIDFTADQFLLEILSELNMSPLNWKEKRHQTDAQGKMQQFTEAYQDLKDSLPADQAFAIKKYYRKIAGVLYDKVVMDDDPDSLSESMITLEYDVASDPDVSIETAQELRELIGIIKRF